MHQLQHSLNQWPAFWLIPVQRLLRLWSLEEAQVLRDTHVLPPPVLQAGLANLERGGSSRGGGKESGMVGRHRMSCNDIIQNHSMQNEYLHLKQEH